MKIITYENGDKVIWSGRAEIHYHQTKIVKEVDLPYATFDEIKALKKNPHDDNLISSIQKRKKIVR